MVVFRRQPPEGVVVLLGRRAWWCCEDGPPPPPPTCLNLDSTFLHRKQTLLSLGADITILDIRRRNVLHFLADSYCTDGTELILQQALRTHVVQQIINQTELYLGGEQCFLVRGEAPV